MSRFVLIPARRPGVPRKSLDTLDFDLLGDAVDGEARIRLRDQRNQLFADYLRRDDLVISGVPAVLERLASRYRMAVVTSSRREHFELVHAHTRLRQYFEFVLTLEDYARTKPHPDPYLGALSRAGVSAESAVVVEDSPRGVQSAVAAGIPCLVIPRGLSRGGDFSGAHSVLEHIDQVPSAVESLEDADRIRGGPR